MRDHNGTWVRGFSINLGTGDILQGELWGIWHGPKMVIDLQKEKVILESDCKEAVELIQQQWNPSCRHTILVRMCQQKLERKPSFWICHITRDANVAADRLPKLSYQEGSGLLTHHCHQDPLDLFALLLSLDMYELLPNGL